ncbi:CAP domain-containing protein [Aeoliella sp.]|uniref:CAP domain-containing protein n=1 Tax=Aeoliella sp. TaxID=2795800 RepID=UPI003CCB8B46
MYRARSISTLTLSILLSASATLNAETLWTEGAENGLAYVIDGTSSTYDLIHSNYVAKGDYAFHLANASFNDNWFVIDQDITPQADTKLFFQSRMSWTTPGQVAKVQLSTNGGSSWSTDLYTQYGSNNAGEGTFNLRTVDLSAYANQSVRFRFYLDFTGGSVFVPQEEYDIGWNIDDIQIGSQLEKQQYSIGDPTAHEQQYLEYINRARADAIVEANRLANETDPDVTSAYNFFRINTQDIVDQFEWSVANGLFEQVAQPLSFNEQMIEAARLHSQDMYNNQFQGHYSSANPPSPLMFNDGPGDRLDAVGYDWASYGENVFAYADSVTSGHAGFDVDWGNVSNPGDPNYNPAFAGEGMQNPAGHRLSIHNDLFKEIGVGVVNGTNGSVGPQIVTQDFGYPGEATFITGVVFEDLNGNNFYDIGEGRSGVRVDIAESAYYAISSTSGAYTIPVDGDGSYLVEFTGGDFADYSMLAEVSGGKNVKVDYLATSQVYLAADYNQNGIVDMPDYELWKQTLGSTEDLRADGNGDLLVNLADYTVWRNWLGATTIEPGATTAIPEPTGMMLTLLAVGGVVSLRRRSA